MKSKLTILSEQEFNRRKAETESRAQKAGLNVTIEDPEDLKAAEKVLRASHSSNRDIPFNSNQNPYMRTRVKDFGCFSDGFATSTVEC